MGRDLTLYPKDASKAELASFVKSFDNVYPSHPLWASKGHMHFRWFDSADYKSVTGVEITIHPVDSEKDLNSKWVIHVRNTYSASWHDVSMLNTILRTGRKRFGGDIFGDYGKNGYAPLWEDDSTPMSRGLAWVQGVADKNLQAISHSLPTELDLPSEMDTELEKLMRSADPSRVIYNGLVPFLVSVLEFYLKSIFIIALKYDPTAQDKVRIYSRDAASLPRGVTVELAIADSISFQDLHNVKKAYIKWLGIDIRVLLGQAEVTAAQSPWQRLGNLIDYRHDIIHRMGVDANFSRSDFLDEAQLVEECLGLLLKALAMKYQVDIEIFETKYFV